MSKVPMKKDDTHSWPPTDELTYFGSPSFVEHAHRVSKRLRKQFPTWAEDAVFDTVADLIERVCADHPKKEPIRLDEFSGELHFLAYVSVACRHRAIDRTRKGKRQVAHDESSLATLASADPEPEAFLHAEDFLANIKSVLPEQERQVVLFHYLGGCSQREVADRLSMSRSYVSKILKSAIRRLKRHFELE